MATITDFDMFCGEDYSFPDTIIGSSGAPINISTWSLKFTFCDTWGNILVTKTLGLGMVLTDPTNGVVTIYLTSLDTLTLPPGNYSWSVKRVDYGNDAVVSNGAIFLKATAA